jgi:hypothetical protein
MEKSHKTFVDKELLERDYALLRTAYTAFDDWLFARRGIETLELLEIKLRSETKPWLTNDPKRYRTGKQLPWAFDSELFPSLFEDGISVLHKGEPMTLPDSLEWSIESVRQHVHDPVAKLLLAVIWKQRDFSKVRLVLGGFRSARKAAETFGQDTPSVTIAAAANDVSTPEEQETSSKSETKVESSAVFSQFGRHLAEPKREPIFDQHTSRASMLLMSLSKWNHFDDFKHLFNGVPPQIPFDAAKITAPEQCLKYITWWKQHVRPRLPALGSDQRQEEMVLVDRLLFGLGKWATPKKWKIEKPEKKRKQKGPAADAEG